MRFLDFPTRLGELAVDEHASALLRRPLRIVHGSEPIGWLLHEGPPTVGDEGWQLDSTWAELDVLINSGQVIESHNLGEARLMEIRLMLDDGKLPLHLA